MHLFLSVNLNIQDQIFRQKCMLFKKESRANDFGIFRDELSHVYIVCLQLNT